MRIESTKVVITSDKIGGQQLNFWISVYVRRQHTIQIWITILHKWTLSKQSILNCLNRLLNPQGFLFISLSNTYKFTVVASFRFSFDFNYRLLRKQALLLIVGFGLVFSPDSDSVSTELLASSSEKIYSSISLLPVLTYSPQLMISLSHWCCVLKLQSSNHWIQQCLSALLLFTTQCGQKAM